MKILVLQLARLGDIYQSWPAVRALRRAYPDAQIDMMVRPRFEAALNGLEAINERILLPTQDLLSPLVSTPQDLNQSLSLLGSFLDRLKSNRYDWVVNFSFSPLSSYLVHSLQTEMTQVTGYTRHADGYFNMIGEISAYFYAQVGVDRKNRFHLTDLMAAMVGTDLTEADWADPRIDNSNLNLPENYVVVHVGASETQKSLPAFKWARVIKYFTESRPDLSVVLIGSRTEKSIAEAVLASANSPVVNLVGQTELTDLFPIIRNSQLLVGCDSAPMHIASLTKTPCLNLSLGNVNFWETGPRSPKSYIFRAQSVEEVVSEYMAAMMKDILEDREPKALIKYVGGSPCYSLHETDQERFCWELIKAVYMNEPYPITDDYRFFDGCSRLHQINNVILEQLQMVPKSGLEKLKPILDRSDEVINALGEVVPELQIFIRWLKTERARVEPGPMDKILESTVRMHQALRDLIRPYILEDQEVEEGGADGKV